MAASTTDKFRRAFNSANPVTTYVTSTRSSGATTLSCNNLTGWPTDTAVDFVTYQLATDGVTPVAGTQIDWKGIVSGSTITDLTREAGATDTGNAVNDVVEAMPTASWGDDLVTGVLTHADQDGTLKAGAVDGAGVLASNVVTTAKILDANITTSKLEDGAVTPGKRSGGFKVGVISGSTLSTTGNKAITGLGFKPRLVRFSAMVSTGASANIAYGAMDEGGNQYAVAGSHQSTTTNSYREAATNRCLVVDSTGTSTQVLALSYVSMNTDGFTVNVDVASTLSVAYEAYS